MKNNIFILFIVLVSSVSFSQVGIGTTTPQATLHVNGKMQITKALKVGGNATTAGNAGRNGQFLSSQGDDLPPKWIFPAEQNIPKLVGMTEKTTSESVSTNTYTTLNFTINPDSVIDEEYISYSNGIFTVKKEGFYQISGNVKVTPPSGTDNHGTAASNIVKDGTRIARVTSANPLGSSTSDPRYLDILCVHKFLVGETFLMEAVYSRAHEIGNASISVTFLSVN